MPRRPDLPCADCGELMWRGTTSLPEGQARCRPCRARSFTHGTMRGYKKFGCRCDLCRTVNNAAAREHQRRLRERQGRIVRKCAECGENFNPRSNQIICSPACRKIYYGRFGDHYSRAQFFGVEYEVIDRSAVFERDGWCCGICGLDVDPAEPFPEPGAATIDHVVPMSRGGGHTWTNVQLAHFYCNTVKGAREVAAC